MADTTLPALLDTGNHAGRPAASAVGSGALYSCTDHDIIYQSDGSSWTTWATVGGPGAPAAGSVLQVVTATSTADDTTTAATLQASSLSATITPQEGDSKLLIRVDGECAATRAAGTIAERYMWVAIQNTTNAVTVVEQVRGHNLVATSAVGAGPFHPIALQGLYTVNSTTARTFQLQFRAGVVTNVLASINGSRTGGILMTIFEIAV
jgi:uncharacterized protein YndB with AHSA1/START domain